MTSDCEIEKDRDVLVDKVEAQKPFSLQGVSQVRTVQRFCLAVSCPSREGPRFQADSNS